MARGRCRNESNHGPFPPEKAQAIRESLCQQGVAAEVEFCAGPSYETKPFGTLLALDLYECPLKPLESIEIGYHFLSEIVSHLGMTMQSPPFVFLSDAQRFPDKAGLSGWVPLIESGVTLHTLIRTRFATVDIYSCGAIRPVETIAFAHKIFSPKRIEATYLYRGRNYPPS